MKTWIGILSAVLWATVALTQTSLASKSAFRTSPCVDPLSIPEFRSAQQVFETSTNNRKRLNALKQLLDLAKIEYNVQAEGWPGFRKFTVWLEPNQELKTIFLELTVYVENRTRKYDSLKKVEFTYSIPGKDNHQTQFSHRELFMRIALGYDLVGQYSLSTQDLLHIIHERMKQPTAPTSIQKTHHPTTDDTCFPASAKVTLANGQQKSIAQIKPGDRVLAYSIALGETVPRKVLRTFEHSKSKLFQLNFQDGSKIISTNNHPYYSLDQSRYVEAKDLQSGERVLSKNGTQLSEKVFMRLEETNTSEPVFNIEVEEDNNYFIDDTLVHNKEKLIG